MKKLLTIITIACLTFTVGCSQTDGNQNVLAENTPVIEFDVTDYDYGTITQGADGSYEFVFTNKGDAPLIISNVKSSCGCTIPKKPDGPINPGDKSSIKVKYDTKRIGSFTKSITVTSNAKNPTTVLRIRGVVEPTATPEAAAVTE